RVADAPEVRQIADSAAVDLRAPAEAAEDGEVRFRILRILRDRLLGELERAVERRERSLAGSFARSAAAQLVRAPRSLATRRIRKSDDLRRGHGRDRSETGDRSAERSRDPFHRSDSGPRSGLVS